MPTDSRLVVLGEDSALEALDMLPTEGLRLGKELRRGDAGPENDALGLAGERGASLPASSFLLTGLPKELLWDLFTSEGRELRRGDGLADELLRRLPATSADLRRLLELRAFRFFNLLPLRSDVVAGGDPAPPSSAAS
mmetsp:Transcript_35246/g.82271  ORF Transcript_35246/g.82271 Transcript_35246/m.82271 type:complete len:138 (-) Transcript_35246:2235-2648(-)